MTLLISILCADGFVIISDRKELEGITTNEIGKSYLSNGDDYFITLAGNGGLPRGILSIVNSSQISSETVEEEIKNYVSDFNNFVDAQSRSDSVKGFLVIRKNDQFQLKILDVLGKTTTFIMDSSPLTIIGSELGKIFAQCFLENLALDRMTCNEASKYVIAAVDKLSKYDKYVGGLDYGFDLTMFSITGKITQRQRLTDTDISYIDFNYDIKPKNIFVDNSSMVGQKNGN